MRVPVVVCLTCGLFVLAGFPKQALSQVPTRASEPVLRVPVRPESAPATASPQAAEPAPAPAPAAAPAPTSAAPTAAAPTAAAPAEPAPVSAAPAPSGVTQLPPAAAPPATASTSSAATAAPKGGYGAANFALSVDGVNAGILHAVEGGAAVGTVVVGDLGPDNIRKKHVSGVKYEELSFDVGFDSKPVIDWVSDTWKGKYLKKNGSIQIADHNYNVVAERQFTDALITGTTIAALDASNAKKPVQLTVTVAPEYVRDVKGGGKAQPTSLKSRPMLAHFRFEMGDLEASVKRIEPFTVGQKVLADQVGQFREVVKQPNTLEFPNLTLRMMDRASPNWAKWQEDFLLKGNGGEGQEKDGAIVFLDPTLKKELGRINLFQCGLVRLGGDRQERSMDKGGGTLTAELYCERMELAITN